MLLSSSLRILTAGRLAKEFQAFAHELGLVSDYYSLAELAKAPLHTYNAVAGFSVFHPVSLQSIQWIHSFGAGVDGHLQHPDLPDSTLITRTTGQLGRKMAEYCLAYILADVKEVFSTYAYQQQQAWKPQILRNLYNKKVLIVGTGAIGQRIAEMLVPLVPQVDGINTQGRAQAPFHQVMDWTQFTAKSHHPYEFVINTLPHYPATEGLLNKSFFEKFSQSYFITVGRGPTVVIADLLQALENKNLRHALLDVFVEEPLPKDSPLWRHPAITITPHHSGLTEFSEIKESFLEAYTAIKEGRLPGNAIDRSRGY
ncbi:NAD(P)-dependent oxidoreductase [Cytophagales bacterium LB-30]|uniref:NAD(P)-dependent oxidoreductase n=1 Tax=Shiella aurantiaca TaxID=3058365 RepID=A0ABT8F6S3_9BACT|nr:NAD(P)-dependent oxidoreductase [Shiella aurantiaca]MDN4166069.1 NAD(P)-dependent oxidoreductase [Shiella aurantiaca]